MDNNYKSIDEIIAKMKGLRQKRELEILNSQLERINLDTDYQENLNDSKVLNVKYIGEIQSEEKKDNNIENSNHTLKKQTSIFLLIEQKQDKDGNQVIVEKYYTEDFELLGGNNKSDGFDYIMLSRDFANEKELLEDLNTLDKEGKLDLEKIERKELEEIAKALGINKNDIKKMSQVDLAKEIEKNTKEKENENKEEKNEEQELNKEETKQILNGKQEMKTNIKVDNKQTLGKVLNLDTSEFTKIAIVYSEKLKDVQDKGGKINSTRYSFVAIRKDGTAQTINDRLEIDSASGSNPYQDSIKIDADKTAREDDKTCSRYKINGKNEYLSVENGQYGELKAYYGKGKTRSENEAVETQLETTNVRPTSIDIRKLQATYKAWDNTDKMAKEANKHFDKHKEEKVGLESIDGDEQTIDHIHVADYTEEGFHELAEEMMKNDDIEIEFTTKEVEKMIKNYWKEDIEEDKEYTVKEMEIKIKDTEKLIEQDAINLEQQKNRRQ